MITIPVTNEPIGQYDGAAPVQTSGKYSGRNLATDMASSASYVGVKTPQLNAIMQARETAEFQGDKEKLFRSVSRSYRELEQFRDMNEKLVEDYAGPHYQQGDNKQNRYVNLMNQAVDAYQMLLAANRPRVMVSTSYQQYKVFSKQFEHAINTLMKEIRLEQTLEKWVMDAFFCMGIVKTHLADSGLVEVETDLWMDPGKPFASNIALDDFVYDMSANKWSECKFAGDMYRISYEDAVEIFGEEAMKDHTPGKSNAGSANRVESISKHSMSSDDEFEPMIDLADIWVPRQGLIYTFVVSSRRNFDLSGEPIAVEPWEGPETGPYHLLGFNDVPENIMFSSPASHLEMLDALVNDLYRKSSRQARRQKDVHLYTAAGAGSAQQIQMADDGEWVNVNDTSDISMMKQGGVDASNYQFMVGAIDTFDRMAGNLQAQLGLGAQAETLGQEQLMHGAASQKIDKMGKRVTEKVVELITALGQMLWDDAFKEVVSEVTIPGTNGISVTSTWKPGERQGNFIDYNFDIDVYSMQYQGPKAKIQQLNQLISSVYVPMAQILQQQGGMLDMIALTRQYAELLNLPELSEIVKFTGGAEPAQTSSPTADVPTKPPTSTRNYVRTNVSAASNESGMQQAAGQMGGMEQGPQTQGGMT
jgi:hypothetical protein